MFILKIILNTQRHCVHKSYANVKSCFVYSKQYVLKR
jgi:hypothetical protein